MKTRQLRQHIFPLFLWTVFWLLFFGPLLAGTHRLPNSDFSGQFYAAGLFQAREMAQGRLPVWSPGSYGGIPFAADTQTAVFYPLRWLTILLSLPWGFSFYALELEGIFHIWLAGVLMYCLAYDLTKVRAAAVLGAIGFGLGGYLTSYPLLQLAVLETITWLPLVLLLVRRASQQQRPLRWLLAAGGVLGMAALAGHPQTFLHVSYLAAAYYLFKVVQARWSWRWCLGGGVVVGGTAVGLAMMAWLPAIHYLTQTTRQDVGYDFVSAGLPLLNLAQLLVPGTLSFWVPEYVGLAAVCLVLFAWYGRHHLDHTRAELTFWAVAVPLLAWIALGDRGILFELVYRIAPGFAFFRRQERLMGLVSFGLVVMAVQGAALWLRLTLAARRAILKRVGIAVGMGLLLIGFIFSLARPIVADEWLVIWGRQWLVTAVVLIALWGGWRQSLLLWSVVMVLGVDLYLSIGPALDLQPEPPSVFWPQPTWLKQIEAEQPGRIDSSSLFHLNVGEAYGLEDIRGISPLKLAIAHQFQQVPRPVRWQLLNVTHLITQERPQAGWTEIGTVDHSLLPGETLTAFVYRHDQPQPRAWMSYQPILVPDAAAALQRLQTPDFDAAAQVVLQGAAIDLTAVSPPVVAPEVAIVRSAPNQMRLAVTTATPGLLVISEWAYPGWQAAIDGERVALLTADYALQAVLVPAGSHTVDMRFVPYDVIAGMSLTMLTLLLALAIGWRWQPVVAYGTTLLPRLPTPAPVWASPGAVRASPLRAVGRYRLPSWRTLLLLVVLLGFGLRLPHLGSQELRGDEAFSYLFSRLPVGEIVPELIDNGDPHSPLHYLLLHGWMAVAGTSEFAMRYLSLIPGVLLIPLVAQVGRRLGGRRLGVLTAVFIALSQSQVWISQDVRNQYTLALLFSTLATWVFLRAVRPGSVRWWWWLLYALISVAAIYAHYYAIFALLGHGLYLLLSPRSRSLVAVWVGSGLLAALLFLPWMVAVLPSLLAAGQLSDPSTPELARYITAVGIELMAGPAYNGPLSRWLFLGVLSLCWLGIYTLRQTSARAWAVMLISWLVGAALVIYLVRFSRSTFNTFYITVAAPAWWLLVGMGILALWQRRQRWSQVAAVASVVAIVTVAAVSLFNYYTNPAAQRLVGYRGIANHLRAAGEPDDVFIANAPDPALVYYLESLPLAYEMQPATFAAAAAETEQALQALAAAYDRLWFVPAPTSVWDEEQTAARWLDYHLLQEQEARYGSLTLTAYRPLHALDAVLSPIEMTINETIQLAGAYLTVDGVPAPLNEVVAVTPGANVAVSLLWQPGVPIPEDYTVFVHLLDEAGSLVAQHDGTPLAGTRPTTTWLPGEPLLDRHELVLPPQMEAFNGRLVVGLYHSQTIERQRFNDGGDALPLVSVRYQGEAQE